MKRDIYKIDNSIEKIHNGKSTYFLDNKEYNEIKYKLKKCNYKEYLPYKTSEKVILYVNEIPNVTLFKINSYEKLRHQDILGALLGLNISSSYIGDIIIDNDNYYFYILSELKTFIKDNLNMIGNKYVTIEEIDLNELSDYERKYEACEIIVSSLRIDNVISKIIKTNRGAVLDKIKNKEIILNYEVLTKSSYTLKENDIFSVRKFGKYKFISVSGNTKKDNLIIKYVKYI